MSYAEKLLDARMLSDCASVLNDNAGVVPPRAVLDAMLREAPEVLFEAAQWGANDTSVRGELSDLAVRKLGVAHSWPSYGDSIDIDAFQAKVNAAAQAAGWHVCNADGRFPGYGS